MSAAERWWSEVYPALSLKDLARFPLFRKMFESHHAYHHVLGTVVEHLWYIDNCKIVEWYDSATHSGEKAGVDRNSGTLFYENWSPQKLAKSWKNDREEWGEVRYKENGAVETWKKSGSVTTLDVFTPVHSSSETIVESTCIQNDGVSAYSKKIQGGKRIRAEEQRTSKGLQETKQWTVEEDKEWGREECVKAEGKTVFQWEGSEGQRVEVREQWANGVIAWREKVVRKGSGVKKTEWRNWPLPTDPSEAETAGSEWVDAAVQRLAAVLSIGESTAPLFPAASSEYATQREQLESLLSALEEAKSAEVAAVAELAEHLVGLVKDTTCTELVARETAKTAQKSVLGLTDAAQKTATQLHIEVNTLRRNQATMELVIEKLVSFAEDVAPEIRATSGDFGERLARTMEGLVEVEKAVRLVRKKEKSEGIEEMEEFPAMLRNCFLLGFEVLAKAATLRPLDPDNPALELLRSTKWIREGPSPDSNTNRQMLVNFLHSALSQSLALLPRVALAKESVITR